MKLWLLKNKTSTSEALNPWEPWFDKAFGFVVRAETEREARLIADENAGEENAGARDCRVNSRTKRPWLRAEFSTCIELTQNEEAGLILQDFSRA